MNNNKAQPEKQQEAMALEFDIFVCLFLLLCSFYFHFIFVLHEELFLPAGTLHFWKLGEK